MREWIVLLSVACACTLSAGIVVSHAGPSGTDSTASGWDVVNVAADDPAGGVSLAVTRSGAVRIAYINAGDRLKYALCDGECLDPAHWTVIDLGEADTSGSFFPVALNLAVGPDDRAHILYGTAGSYTTCAGSCSDPGSWTAPVNVVCETAGKVTALALNAAGNPRAHCLGHAYARCDGNCGDAAGWTCSPTGLDALSWFPAGNSLAVQTLPGGEERPRILGQWYWPTGGGINAYVASSCDGGCADPSGWVHEQGHMSFWSGDYVTAVKLDSLGAPHFLVASYGYGVTASAYGAFGMTFDGRSALSLALSDGDAPRIAMLDETGALDFASCDAGCDLPENWSFQDVTPEVSMADMNLPRYVETALDPAGRALFAYKFEGQLRFAAPVEPVPPWGPASTVEKGAAASSAMFNAIFLLLPPLFALLFRMRRRGGRGPAS